MKSGQRLFLFAPLLFSLCWPPMARAQAPAAPAQAWIETWAASQQIPEPRNSLPAADLDDATVRQIFHVSIAGPMLRVRLSNAFGTEPLTFTAVHVARPIGTSAAIVPGSDAAVTFSGSPSVTVPAGAEYWSDPVNFAVTPLSSVTVSFHLASAPARQTGHPGSRETSYFVHGDLVAAADLPGAQHVDHWYEVSGIEVPAPPGGGDVVALGDSITDGHATTTNGNNRWTDDLAERLQSSPATHNVGVLNEGIGGNRLLEDGLGPNVLARFDRDVLAQAGVRWVIVLEGVNDLGALTRVGDVPVPEHRELVRRIIGAYEQIVLRAHAAGLRVIGGTLTPFLGSGYYHPGPQSEADRVALNAWIRTPGHFDAVVDFDRVIRDPEHPEQMLPQYDSGDHLHPSVAGYRAMAEAIPLGLFQ